MITRTCCHFSYERWNIFEEELHFLHLFRRFTFIGLILIAVWSCCSSSFGCLFAQLIKYYIYFRILTLIACTRNNFFLTVFCLSRKSGSSRFYYLLEIVGWIYWTRRVGLYWRLKHVCRTKKKKTSAKSVSDTNKCVCLGGRSEHCGP